MILKNVGDLIPVPTTHGQGNKIILAVKEECASNLTQAAIGEVGKGVSIPCHRHPSMEEFYFINEGEIVFVLDGADYPCTKGSFIKIPAGKEHGMTAKEDTRFIYWGVGI